MRRVRSQFPGPVFRLAFAVRGRNVARVAAVVAAIVSLAMVAVAPAQAGKIVDRVIGNTTTGTTGGLFNVPQDLAVNTTGVGGVAAGTFYVADQTNHRIQRFAPSGSFELAWGADVNLPAGGTAFETCSVAVNCKAGVSNAGAGGLANPQAVAVDGDTGYVYVSNRDNRRIDVFDAAGAFLRTFGFDVASAGPGNTGTGFEVCVPANGDTCKVGVGGAGVGQYGTGTTAATYGIAVTPSDGNAATGKVYLANSQNQRVEVFGLDGVGPANFGSASNFATTQPRKIAVAANGIVYASDSSNQNEVERYDVNAASFLTAIPVATVAGDVTSTQATNGLAIDRDGGNLLVARANAAAGIVEIASPSTAPTLADRHLTTLVPAGVAVNPNSDEILTFLNHRVLILDSDGVNPKAIATVGGTTNVGPTTATVNGTVDSNGPMPTDYRFEVSRNGIDWSTMASGTVPGGASQPVSAAVTDLLPNTFYRVRMVTNKTLGNPDAFSAEGTFLTDAVKPEIVSSWPDTVQATSVNLVGYVNPHSTPTSYRFEWGTEPGSYPNRLPATNAFLGSGPTRVLVRDELGGLEPATTYYFRLVAISATEGATTGPERTFTTPAGTCPTVNTAGLPSCRSYELVSPANAAPIGEADGYVNLVHPGGKGRVSRDGSRASYIFAYGLPDSTIGGDVTYRAARTVQGWTSDQLSPSSVGPSGANHSGADSAYELYASDDLSCGFVVSQQPLADDAPTEVLDAGGVLLFRRNPDDTYTTVTTVVPTSPGMPSVQTPTPAEAYVILGASADCSRVVFTSVYRYPGVSYSSGIARTIYRWDDGELENVGVVPGPSGPVPAADPEPGFTRRYLNAVSEDASRVVFTATSQAGPDVGKQALFVRDGDSTVDVSQSQTATVNQGAFYQDASEDGSKVFFLANYGLTGPVANGVPATTNCNTVTAGAATARCDLYEYSLDTGQLTNLSATGDPANTNGAMVEGVLDASDNGDYVYFAARGQLIPGKGNTYAQNQAASGGYNLYLAHDGELTFVTALPRADVISGLGGPGLFTSPRQVTSVADWASRVTPDGAHLLFQSSGNLTGYDSGGAYEAYRYSAPAETLVCLSCRRDDEVSVPTASLLAVDRPLPGRPTDATSDYLNTPRSMSDDGSRVFFKIGDALAPGATDGYHHLYQWENGKVSLLVTQAPSADEVGRTVHYLGASADGDSAFFSTRLRLVAEDKDNLRSIYVARVGGGFAPPPSLPPACAVLDDGCQVGGAQGVPVAPGTGTAASDGNAVPSRKSLSVSRVGVAARRRAARSGVLSISVRTDAPGRVSAAAKARIGKRGRRVAAGSIDMRQAGTARIDLRLSRAARKRLQGGHGLSVTVEVSSPSARSRSMTVLLRRSAS
jgi:hypothetical protein